MAKEIERKYLAKIDPAAMDEAAVTERMVVKQGYPLVTKNFEWRLRSAKYWKPRSKGTSYTMAFKIGVGLVRDEFEWEIPKRWFTFLSRLVPSWLYKVRVEVDGWELDVFFGTLAGLEIAEFESNKVLTALPRVPKGVELLSEITGPEFANKFLSRLSPDQAWAKVDKLLAEGRIRG